MAKSSFSKLAGIIFCLIAILATACTPRLTKSDRSHVVL